MKNIGFLVLIVLATLLFTVAFPAAAGPKASTAPVVAAVPAAAAVPVKHEHIHEALEAMREAKRQLEAAVPEYHGHRAEAIKHLDAAIHEAEICDQEP